jgi:hypothetical protein
MLQLLLFCAVPFAFGQPTATMAPPPFSVFMRPDEDRCVEEPPNCLCHPSLVDNCTIPAIERTTDLCYLSCCCDIIEGPRFALAPAKPDRSILTTEAISVLRFVEPRSNHNEQFEASWSVVNKADAMCNFRWEGNDNRVDFDRVPAVVRASPLVTSLWSKPTQPLPDPALTMIVGFQLNVYMLSDASKPACAIEHLVFENVTATFQFTWNQFIVTDSDARVRRYVFRWHKVPIPGHAEPDSGWLTNPPTLSMVVTRSGLNGTCWLDCVELQLLFFNQEPTTTTTTTTTTTRTVPTTSPSTPSETTNTDSTTTTTTTTTTSTSNTTITPPSVNGCGHDVGTNHRCVERQPQ